MNGCLPNPFGSNFSGQSIVSIPQLSFEQYTQCSGSSLVFGTSSSICSSQNRFFSCFLLYCWVLAVFVLSAHSFCPDFLSCPAIFLAFSELFQFTHSTTGACEILLSTSPHEHISSQPERTFVPIFFIINYGPSLNHRRPSMGPLRMTWLSVNCTGVSVQTRLGPDSKHHQFHHNCEELLLRKLFVKNFLIKHEFLIVYDVRKLDFLNIRFFSGITALTEFNRNASGLNSGPCRYRGIKGVLLQKLAALLAFTPLYQKTCGVFSKKFDPGSDRLHCFLKKTKS